MLKKVIYFCFLLLSLSCASESKDSFWFLKKDKDYSRIKSVFNDYIDFFPSQDQAKCKNYSWSLNSDREYNIKAVFRFPDSTFTNINARIENDAIVKYPSDKNCLLVLNRFATHQNYGYPEKHEIDTNLINRDCYDNLYPIPNFSNFSKYQSNETECKLTKDFTVYVLEAKTGKFLDRNKLTLGTYMPKNWKNGFSKGVAISNEREVIIFWVIIW